ncbi:MAG TPA: DUF721 domain-containing protein [Planctomycetota bacterium]|nr:DUF721 domain-containing protein [Planctomycetota bacterium]HUV38003.1 DUF721 domain-containing protein [Planctomycetota bacterium]
MRPGRRRIGTLREAIASFLEISGLGRRTLQDQVSRAWCEAVGAETAKHTRPARTIRAGVLEVEVDSSSLLAELGGFRRAEILAVLREQVRGKYIEDIRFRLGTF